MKTDKTFAIVDIETTGGMVKRDRMTEIAIVLSNGQEIIGEYESLINPGISIPPFITKITGITDEMVADAPTFPEVARQIVEWTDGHIFVAHNVRFDYGFIRQAFAELGFPYNRRRMCTVQMSKRLLGLPSNSLESLIKYYQIDVSRRHRALDDARATAVVLHNLLEMEGSKSHINQQINRGVRESLLPPSITVADLHNLPEEPGLYYFYDEKGDLIYIGKSKNIQKRVMSHFTKTTRKAELLQKRMFRIEYQLTGNDLLAQIIEAQEIKNSLPEMNKAQRNSRFDVYIKTSVNELGYRRFEITKKPHSEDHLLNAYSSAKNARNKLQMLIHEYGLCPLYCHIETGMGPCSKYQYDLCNGACIHEESSEDYNVRADLAMAHIQNTFDRDFFLVDEGRNKDEKALILVKDGHYYGHQFVASDSSIISLEDLLEHIPQRPFYPEINSMVMKYTSKGLGKVQILN